MSDIMTFTVNAKRAAALSALAVAMAQSAEARDIRFGLSSSQSTEAVTAQVEQALMFAASALQAGDTAFFFDATQPRLLGTFTVPAGKAYGNPRARLKANTALVRTLKTFIDGAEPVPGRTGQIDLPGFLRLLRGSYGGDADVVVIGSPIHDDPRAPSLSMRGARVFNDGHIAATVGQSPYGTQGLPGSLEGADVYVGLVGEDWTLSSDHAYHVERGWSLSVEGHGAQMAFFGDDLNTLFRMVAADAPGQPHAAPLQPTDKLEMLQFAPDTGAPSLYDVPVQEAPAPQPVWQAAQPVSIGITWDVPGVDIDLYVRPTPQAEVIFFGQAETPFGRLYKDFTQSPNTGFETITLNGAIDLSRMQVALNYYGGTESNGGVSGELRIAIDGEVWAVPYHIAASRGNNGAGAQVALVDMSVPNDAWLLVDPMQVIGAR